MRAQDLAALLLASTLAACSGGDPAPVPAPGSGTTANADRDAGAPEESTAPAPEPEPEEPEPSPEDLAAIEEADRLRRLRARNLFGPVIEPLKEAAEAYEEHDTLEESTWFGKDQEDNLERINELLDDAMLVLGVSELADTRQELRTLEAEIAALEQQLIEDREARLGAPDEEEMGRVEQVLEKSRQEYDQRIADAEHGIADRRERIAELHTTFVRQMRGIGVEIDLEAAKSLLSTVTGDDFVEMCVVFDNVRGVTVQLQELTEESGESLEAAKRYYGSYVVLIRLMDRLQKDFVRRIVEEMIPRLEDYATEAALLIDDARENMANGGDPRIGEQNIRSNELTIRATGFYADYLRLQAAEVQARNERLQIDLRDAENTYDTVVLSSEVASLLREGARNFAALAELDVPPLRGFENAELEAEFERLTEKMVRPD